MSNAKVKKSLNAEMAKAELCFFEASVYFHMHGRANQGDVRLQRAYDELVKHHPYDGMSRALEIAGDAAIFIDENNLMVA